MSRFKKIHRLGRGTRNPKASEVSNLQDHGRAAKQSLTEDSIAKQLDAKPLSRLEVFLARLCLLDLFKRRPRLLPKRMIGVVSFVNPLKRNYKCLLMVETSAAHMERGAVALSVTCYTWYGRKIKVTENTCHHKNLFADPLDQAVAQPSYFTTPKHTVWAVAKLQRCVAERRITAFGSLRLKKYSDNLLPYNQVVKSRDYVQLRQHLNAAFETQQRDRALKLLEQLIFLGRNPNDIQMMKVIRDVEQVLSALNNSAFVQPAETSDTFQYTKTFTSGWDGGYPLSKWLMSECAHLRAHAGARTLVIADGPDVSLRIFAAVYAQYMVDVLPALDTITNLAWIKAGEVRAAAQNRHAQR